MSEHARAISLALHEVKRNIHEYAVHTRERGLESYVTLKTVDAIIDQAIRKYWDQLPKEKGNDRGDD